MINDFIVSAVDFFGTHFNDIASFFLVLIAVLWFCKYDMLSLSKIRKSLKTINDEINTIGGYEIENIKKINSLMDREGHPIIKEIWVDYYDDFMNIMNKEKSPDIKDYFSITSTVVVPSSRKKSEAVPGILVAMGVLGTFLGLAVGVGHLDLSNEALLQESMSTLLGGLSTAFVTIIVAVTLSIVYQLLDKSLYHKTIKEIYTFHSLVERKIPMTSDTRYFEMLVREQQLQTACMQDMGQNIAAQLNGVFSHDLIPSINKTFEDSIKLHIGPSISTISEMIYELSKISLENQKEGMQKMVDSFICRLNLTFNQQFKEFGDALKELSDSQIKTKEHMDILMKELIQSTSNQKEVNSTCESIVNTLAQHNRNILDSGEELADIMEKTNKLMDTISIITETNNEMQERLNKQRIELEDEIQEILYKFTETTANTIEKVEKGMGSQVESIEAISERMAVKMEELNSNLGNSVKQFNEQMHNGIMNTFSDFDEGLSDICKRFSNTITEIKDSVDDLPMVLKSMKDQTGA